MALQCIIIHLHLITTQMHQNKQIGELGIQSIKLIREPLSQKQRKAARIHRRDFFENKPLRPNFFADSDLEPEVYRQKKEVQEKSVKQEKEAINKFFDNLDQQLPKRIQSKSAVKNVYKRSHRRMKTTTNEDHQSKIIRTNQENAKSECNSFIFDEQDDTPIIKQIKDDKLPQDPKIVFDEVQGELKNHKIQQNPSIIFDEIPEEQPRESKLIDKLCQALQTQKQQSEDKDNVYRRRKYAFRSQRHTDNNKQKQQISRLSTSCLKRPSRQNLNEPTAAPMNQPKKNLSNISVNTKIKPGFLKTFASFTVKRQKSWAKEKYQLIDQANGNFVMSASVLSRDKIYIYDRKQDYKDKDPYILRMKANFSGSTIHVYSSGISISEAQSSTQGDYKVRQLISTIQTEQQSMFEEVKPRKFHVYMLSSKVKWDSLPKNLKQKSLHQLYHESDHYKKYIHYFENRRPTWNSRLKVHVLDMFDRAQCSSIKNFILLDKQDQQCLLFGKVSKDTYNLDLKSSFPPIMGFCFALSTFFYRNW